MLVSLSCGKMSLIWSVSTCVTFNLALPAVTVLRPGDFALRVRDHLSGLTREGA